MPRHAVRHRRVVNALTVALDACRGVAVRSTLFQFDVLICGPSTQTTSAPWSASIWLAYGPIITDEKSRTRTPRKVFFNGRR